MLLTHREVYTDYLRNAPREGRTIVTNWVDWKDQEGIAQCEECRKYGDFGSEVYFEANNEVTCFCEECHAVNNLGGLVADVKKAVKEWGSNHFNAQEINIVLKFNKIEASLEDITLCIETLYKRLQFNSIWFVA